MVVVVNVFITKVVQRGDETLGSEQSSSTTRFVVAVVFVGLLIVQVKRSEFTQLFLG